VRREALEAAKVMKPGSELNLVSAFIDRCSKRRRTKTAERATINVTTSVATGNVRIVLGWGDRAARSRALRLLESRG
jgi:hypothetical protein